MSQQPNDIQKALELKMREFWEDTVIANQKIKKLELELAESKKKVQELIRWANHDLNCLFQVGEDCSCGYQDYVNNKESLSKHKLKEDK